ncbi:MULTISPECIES: M50 family metallopeptidase [Brachybacterium]|uniref:Zinc metalloprotease n=2 Tax=Brachybacterium TaxID=43668 RepID=A0A3R8SS29_9MICO|nr:MULTISPECIES: site-2 protease family protein [Brachybacterium]RRR20163.1 zinc metalloprotease [Brachybacterium paraconglomeratum]GLI32024.1 peptidase [Brachybacterium conglomeratum]GLK03558.1 peptidase [Brachybacterium conglomeratum]
MLLFALGVLVIAAGLALSIALHEIGHLVPAKLFGVRVTQYMIGFGPTVLSRTRGETEYGLKAIPLGGYIRMIGMYPPHKGEPEGTIREDSTGLLQQMTEMSEDAKAYESAQYGPEDAHRTFVALSVPKKLVVMLGGPTMNLLISVLLMVVLVSGIGLPSVTPTVQSVSECVVPADAPADVSCEGQPPAPALEAGIRPGDVLREIDGAPITRWEDVTEAVRAADDRTIEVVVERDGREIPLEATLVIDARPVLDQDGAAVRDADGRLVTEEVGFLGVAGTPDLVPQSPTEVPAMAWDAFVRTGQIVVTLPVRLYEVGQAAFGSAERDPDGPLGVVGVSRLAGEVASADEPGFELREKVGTMISMLASLNMALFVFNLVPLLPLDGGHVAGALLEGIRRRIARLRGRPDPGPVDMSRMLPLTNAVALVFIVMTLLLLYADIVKPITLFP